MRASLPLSCRLDPPLPQTVLKAMEESKLRSKSDDVIQDEVRRAAPAAGSARPRRGWTLCWALRPWRSERRRAVGARGAATPRPQVARALA